MTAYRVCPKCGSPRAQTAPCRRCGFTPRRMLSTTGRGYGTQHQHRRTAALAALHASPTIELCGICGLGLKYGQQLDLDHTTPLHLNPLSVGDRLVHAHCNRSLGATTA